MTWAGSATGDFYPVDPRVHRHKLNSDTARPGLVRRLTRGLSVIVYLRALMRRIAPDCVLSFIDQSNVLIPAAATGLPVRVVVAERIDPRANDTLGRGWALARLLTYPRAQLVVAQTDAVATDGATLARAHGEDSELLRSLLRADERAATLPALYRPTGAPKGLRRLDPGLRQHCTTSSGMAVCDPLVRDRRDEWMNLCHRLGVSERVHFAGLVDNVGIGRRKRPLRSASRGLKGFRTP